MSKPQEVTPEAIKERTNGLDLAALGQVIEDIKADPAKAQVGFRVTSRWQGQTRSETSVDSWMIAGEEKARGFKVVVDEPLELLGENTAPNPQEMLMAALNACITVGYVVGAAVRGITLDSLEIETAGELDLRGFLGIDDTVPAGYETISYTVRMKGNGTPDQYEDIHQNVIATSPNYFNVSRPIEIDATLVVE